MGSRGEEILARVQQRISALEDELQNELEKHNRAAVAHIQHQIQDLQAKYSGTLSYLAAFPRRVLVADLIIATSRLRDENSHPRPDPR
jgi:hypothetical protein